MLRSHSVKIAKRYMNSHEFLQKFCEINEFSTELLNDVFTNFFLKLELNSHFSTLCYIFIRANWKLPTYKRSGFLFLKHSVERTLGITFTEFFSHFFFQVAKNMGSVVKSLDKAINSMELQKISEVMEKFESQFEDLDVRTSVSIILQIDLNIIEIFLVLVILIPLSKCYQLWNKFVESKDW